MTADSSTCGTSLSCMLFQTLRVLDSGSKSPFIDGPRGLPDPSLKLIIIWTTWNCTRYGEGRRRLGKLASMDISTEAFLDLTQQNTFEAPVVQDQARDAFTDRLYAELHSAFEFVVRNVAAPQHVNLSDGTTRDVNSLQCPEADKSSKTEEEGVTGCHSRAVAEGGTGRQAPTHDASHGATIQNVGELCCPVLSSALSTSSTPALPLL